MDIEFVAIDVAEPPDAFVVAFDVIYAAETWCRSLVWVDTAVAARFEDDERVVIGVARDTLLDLLSAETVPVSFHARVTGAGATILARATPGDAGRAT